MISEPCLDVGSGTGDLTAAIFAGRHPIAVDSWQPNLQAVARDFGRSIRLLQAVGDRLPLRDSSVGTVLCSEVLEHIEDDKAVVKEIARVLRPAGCLLVTVPSLYYRVDTYLRFLGVRTVHDYPGPEQHVRRGYREDDLRTMFSDAGLEIEEVVYLFGPFAKLAIDMVAVAHRAYQRLVRGRTQWTWSDVVTAEIGQSRAFRFYRRLYPLLRSFSKLDRLFRFRGGFGIAVRARRRER